MLGIGDQELSAEQQEACGLTHYVFEPRMGEHQPLRDAVEMLATRLGPVARIDSNGEHWLAAEARLLRHADLTELERAIALVQEREPGNAD